MELSKTRKRALLFASWLAVLEVLIAPFTVVTHLLETSGFLLSASVVGITSVIVVPFLHIYIYYPIYEFIKNIEEV